MYSMLPITHYNLDDLDANFEFNNAVNTEDNNNDNVSINDIINRNMSISLSIHYNLMNNKLICDQNGSRYLQKLLKQCKNKDDT